MKPIASAFHQQQLPAAHKMIVAHFCKPCQVVVANLASSCETMTPVCGALHLAQKCGRMNT
jgi:hypothetical protein